MLFVCACWIVYDSAIEPSPSFFTECIHYGFKILIDVCLVDKDLTDRLTYRIQSSLHSISNTQWSFIIQSDKYTQNQKFYSFLQLFVYDVCAKLNANHIHVSVYCVVWTPFSCVCLPQTTFHSALWAWVIVAACWCCCRRLIVVYILSLFLLFGCFPSKSILSIHKIVSLVIVKCVIKPNHAVEHQIECEWMYCTCVCVYPKLDYFHFVCHFTMDFFSFSFIFFILPSISPKCT